jgi:hypothetical protein
MRNAEDKFTGTFAGEAPRVGVTAARPTAQQVAITKYAAHAEKLARKPAKVSKPLSRGRVLAILVSSMGGCIVGGGLLFKLSPPKSVASIAGECLLVAAISFVLAILRIIRRPR